ncbi:MAG: TIGR02266 family protein [Sandaracinaceae bacterium]|nr:TIGR02266 family protein [Sandaracinaceae bacterium]
MADDGFEHGPRGIERRQHERFDAELSVDWGSDENFLFSYITNISEMGIFIRSDDPPAVGTSLRLRFACDDGEPLELGGVVAWINPLRPGGENLNPGMGVRFDDLTPDQRERVVELVKTVAYLQDEGGD